MARAARDALLGGADMLQLRDKRDSVLEVARAAKAIGTLCRRHKVPFLVNDRVEAAVAAGADGAHVGQGDIAPELAREILGPRKILGRIGIRYAAGEIGKESRRVICRGRARLPDADKVGYKR
jgi:thiamine-phosphate diphosphorylase